MIVLVGGVKGGSGKTTLATNLTVMRARHGSKVLLIDADEQRTTTLWTAMRQTLGMDTTWATMQLGGKNLHKEISNLSIIYDDIIIDAGGRDTTSQRSALAISDVYLVPFKPRSYDLWTIKDVKIMVTEIRAINPKLIVYAVINQADPKSSDNDDAMNILKDFQELECLDFWIGNRKAFGNAASDGLSVAEMKKKDKKAVEEMNALYAKIYLKHIL